MVIILSRDCEYSEYLAAVECAKAYCDETAMAVSINIDIHIVNTITCEYDEDDRAYRIFQEENIKNLSKYFPELPNYAWISDAKDKILARIEELEERRDAIEPMIVKNSIHALVSDDFDDDCQDFLEASWELRDIDEELDKLRYELEILDK